MIELRKINKHYRADDIETAALAGVDLRIDAGEFVAVMGGHRAAGNPHS